MPELRLQPGSGEWRASATELFYAPTTANELSVATVEVPLVGTLLNICECCCSQYAVKYVRCLRHFVMIACVNCVSDFVLIKKQ